jgi:hypothetical protein
MDNMPGTCNMQSFTRKARLEDFFDDDENYESPHQNNKNKYNSKNDNEFIPKNQKEYGDRKRIKP